MLHFQGQEIFIVPLRCKKNPDLNESKEAESLLTAGSLFQSCTVAGKKDFRNLVNLLYCNVLFNAL